MRCYPVWKSPPPAMLFSASMARYFIAILHWLISTQVLAANGRVFTKKMLGHDVAYAEPLLTDFNPARVMSTLCRVHGHAVTIGLFRRCGAAFFNGRSAAGNFLLLRSDGGSAASTMAREE